MDLLLLVLIRFLSIGSGGFYFGRPIIGERSRPAYRDLRPHLFRGKFPSKSLMVQRRLPADLNWSPRPPDLGQARLLRESPLAIILSIVRKKYKIK
jgi:hypothetical protein